MRRITVDLGTKSYPVVIGEHILSQVGIYLKQLQQGNKILVVSNPTVDQLYGATLREGLQAAGFEFQQVNIPDGEQYKTLETAQEVYNAAFEAHLDRKSTILALGGGVVGDLAGFVAATYMRGLNLVQVPTTLLAQVDSSVGGKVAVNHPKGKNIIGAFYQPQLVWADIATLRTLPEREVKTGLGEVIKYGVIWSKDFFEFLAQQVAAVLKLESKPLLHIVESSCQIKAKVVEQDERENGLRAILNYGHTFGHALESLTNYQTYRHGEAVAIGMVMAANLAVDLEILPQEVCTRIVELIAAYGLPTEPVQVNPDDFIASMYHDKKTVDDCIRYILPQAIGQVSIQEQVPEGMIKGLFGKGAKYS